MKLKDKNYKIVFVVAVVFSFIFFLYNRNVLVEMEKNQAIINEFLQYKDGELKLLDSYDSATSSFSDFINGSRALEIETLAYDLLIDNNKLDYYEVYFNPLYYANYYDKQDQADHEFLNEYIDDMYYTECNGICVDNCFVETNNLGEEIKSGRFFLKNEYNCDVMKEIPVVLGSSYLSCFELNETFVGQYVLEQPLTFVVVGFLNENSSFTIAGAEYNLNDSIILPTLSVNNIKDDREKIIMLSTKIEGFVHYDNAQEYQQVADEINLIAETSGFDYIHVVSAKDYENKFDISYEQAKSRYRNSFILFACIFAGGLLVSVVKRRKNELSE